MSKVIFAIFLVTASALSAAAPEKRRITVTGNAIVKVVPDQVILTFGVESRNLDLVKAKAENDAVVRRLLAAVKKADIPSKDVQTSQLSINPEYDYSQAGGRKFTGYQVQYTMVVTLSDLKKFEGFLQEAVSVGANTVQGIHFDSSDMQARKAEARKLAVKAAKDKAMALAGELGQKVGQPLEITESEQQHFPMARANMMAFNKAAGGDEPTLAPGQISVNQHVTVSFELE